jgi:hypothetical protein
VPCDGDELILTLEPGDALDADNRARFRVPLRTPIRACVPQAIPAALRHALAADGAVTIVGDSREGDIAVVLEATAVPADRPAILITDRVPEMNDRSEAQRRGSACPKCGLHCGAGRCQWTTAVWSGGLRPLLREGGRVAAVLSTGDRPGRLYLDAAALGDGSKLTHRPEFAVMISRVVRLLAGWEDDPVVFSPVRAVQDPMWAERQGRSGDTIAMPGSRRICDLSRKGVPEKPAEPASPRRWSLPRLFRLALVLAFGLFLLEAALHARGRIC